MRLTTKAAVFLPAALVVACTPAAGATATDASTNADVVTPANPCNPGLLENVQGLGPTFCCGGDASLDPTVALASTLVLPDTPVETVCAHNGEQIGVLHMHVRLLAGRRRRDVRLGRRRRGLTSAGAVGWRRKAGITRTQAI